MEEAELDNVLDPVDDAFWSQVGIYKSDEEYRAELHLKRWVKYEPDPFLLLIVGRDTF
jgi:hypothetical protein